jgi:hypothetical protein
VHFGKEHACYELPELRIRAPLLTVLTVITVKASFRHWHGLPAQEVHRKPAREHAAVKVIRLFRALSYTRLNGRILVLVKLLMSLFDPPAELFQGIYVEAAIHRVI